MKVLASSLEIRKAILDIRPQEIAVAYLGEHWDRLIDSRVLERIVVRPSLGTHAPSLRNLLSGRQTGVLGLHPHLHSKIYLGSSAAVVGSCNLSANALGAKTRQIETAILVTEEVELSALRVQFKEIWTQAQRAFPTRESMVDAIDKLELETRRCQAIFGPTDATGPSIQDFDADFDPASRRIHICWWEGEGLAPREDLDKAWHRGSDPLGVFRDYLSFLERDDVQRGDWVLTWKCKSSGLPTKNSAISWMYVHDIVPKALVPETGSPRYTKVAGERRPDQGFVRPVEPFQLDDRVKANIRWLLGENEFEKLRDRSGAAWSLAHSLAGASKFFVALKRACQREQA